MKVAALGRTQWLYDSIRTIAAEHPIVLIGTSPAAPEYSVTETDFARLAQELGCAYFCDPAVNRPEYVELMRKSGAEVAISVNWLTLIGPTVLNLFPHGIINAHAGDLPRFRGNACPNWAILTQESKVVLTLHRMHPELDAGPIFLQREFPLQPTTYIAEVYQFISQNIPNMFAEVIRGLADGSLMPREQSRDPQASLRCFPRLPADGKIDWNLPAETLARLVQASAEPFSGAYTFWGTEKLIVWRAFADTLPYPCLGVPGQVVEIRSRTTGEVLVLCGQGVLALQEIETATVGRKKASEILRSTRIRLGMDFTQEILNLYERIHKLEAQIQK